MARHWIDFTLALSEGELSQAVEQLDETERKAVLRQLLTLFSVGDVAVERAILRLMIERARPLALSSILWARSITSSTDIIAEARKHLEHLGFEPTPERLQRVQSLYAQFVVERERVPVTASLLARQGYRCGHCGLAFCDEDLREKNMISPFGLRGTPKMDLLKPHWYKDECRWPTMDHDWPVSLYGNNDMRNTRVLCRCCNEGKENYLTIEQMRPFTGLPRRSQLTGDLPVPPELFYAQIRLHPQCSRTGKSAVDSELTVQLRNPRFAVVLDNLITIESPGL